jgi:hypothetical protein
LVEIPLTLAMGIEPDSVRIALSLALFIAAWRGHGWAIVLLVVGFVMGALFGLIGMIQVASISRPIPMLVLLVMTAAYAGIVLAFIRSEALDAFFKHQSHRRRRTPGEPPPVPEPMRGPASEEPTNSEDLVTIATFDHRAMADVCRVALAQAGISVFVADDNVIGGFNVLLSNALGGIKVQVAKRDVERALRVVEDARGRGALAASDERSDVPFDPIRFECEECGKPVAFPADRRGKVEVCPHCHEYLDVPE